MDFLQNATDDQIALMGCFVALFTSAALMYVSVFLSRNHRKQQSRDAASQTLTLSAREQRFAKSTETKPRKVA